MGYCHAYSDPLAKEVDEMASEMDDDALSRVISNHLNPEFWKRYNGKPDNYAYVRRWSMICRREGRRRGLL